MLKWKVIRRRRRRRRRRRITRRRGLYHIIELHLYYNILNCVVANAAKMSFGKQLSSSDER
jgi:hypothetical protein